MTTLEVSVHYLDQAEVLEFAGAHSGPLQVCAAAGSGWSRVEQQAVDDFSRVWRPSELRQDVSATLLMHSGGLDASDAKWLDEATRGQVAVDDVRRLLVGCAILVLSRQSA